ncbi:MAG: hypothetical protein Q3971_01825 [Moraxella sp.]|nr:hypothetical protein [Moraxella sp.]
MYSSYTNKSYLIQVATIGKRPVNGYPIIYALDGNAFFGVANSNQSHGENAYLSIIQGVNMAYQACKADSNC